MDIKYIGTFSTISVLIEHKNYIYRESRAIAWSNTPKSFITT